MRVALFFDGKNFYQALRQFDPLVEIDFERLAAWVTRTTGGDDAEFVGAYYYSGHSPDLSVGDPGRGLALGNFLDYLSMVRGFFVRREPRVVRTATCKVCGQSYEYTTEKRVDTRMVAELIQYAAVGAYDVAVLASGDDDFVPAVESVDRLGRRVYVGVWPGQAVARDLRARVFGRVDFGAGLPEFTRERRLAVPPVTAESPAEAIAAVELTPRHEALLRDLTSAESQLSYVSRWYFINRWRGEQPLPAAERERLVEELVRAGRVVRYELLDAKGRNTEALRLAEQDASGPHSDPQTHSLTQ